MSMLCIPNLKASNRRNWEPWQHVIVSSHVSVEIVTQQLSGLTGRCMAVASAVKQPLILFEGSSRRKLRLRQGETVGLLVS